MLPGPSANPYLRPHEDIVLLLVADGELALRLSVVARKRVQGLDGFALQHRQGEFDIGLGILVARLREKKSAQDIHLAGCVAVTHEYAGVVREGGQRHVQRLVHLLGGAFEELAAAYPEERVSRCRAVCFSNTGRTHHRGRAYPL